MKFNQCAIWVVLVTAACVAIALRVLWFKGYGAFIDTGGSDSFELDGDPKEAEAIVKQLARLGNCGESRHGKTYRTLVCTMMRNDLHLREYLIRTLLQGFCHIVIYDNNRILQGRDYNITNVIAPFVNQGLVTHVPHQQDNATLLGAWKKADGMIDCLQKHGSKADWAMSMDSDEFPYISKQNSSVGALNSFLTDLEELEPPVCALQMPWRMMYGEHRILQSEKLLLDAYPDICVVASDIPKVMFMPHAATPNLPHWADCKNSTHVLRVSDEPQLKQELPAYTLEYVHYFARSIEEFIAKSEQSQPPYFRLLRDAYDRCPNCTLRRVPYDDEYRSTVHDLIYQYRQAQGNLPDSGIWLGNPPEFKAKSREDYELYIFMKLRVERKDEWDEAAYLQHNPEAHKFVREGKYADGLSHFLSQGFAQGASSCWKQEDDTPFCIT